MCFARKPQMDPITEAAVDKRPAMQPTVPTPHAESRSAPAALFRTLVQPCSLHHVSSHFPTVRWSFGKLRRKALIWRWVFAASLAGSICHCGPLPVAASSAAHCACSMEAGSLARCTGMRKNGTLQKRHEIDEPPSSLPSRDGARAGGR